MEPRIQYAKTEDGVNIAFWVMGEGPPYVWAPDIPWSHIQLELQQPFYRQWFDFYAARNTLVRFDPRGLGLSDREVHDLSVDSRVLDLEAVVDKLGYETFGLGAVTMGTPLIIAYAARHPERVSRLVLLNAIAGGMDLLRQPRSETLRNLLNSDWELYTESFAGLALGFGKEEASEWASFARACVTPETARRHFDLIEEEDVTECLPQVTAPTLLIHLTGQSSMTMDTTRKLAASIPNAQTAILDGNYEETAQEILTTVTGFLGRSEEEAAAEPPEAGAFRTIFFTDIEESTALTQRLGDAKAREVLREHDRMMREVLKEHGGAEVKAMGDGFMASFSSATKALECAIATQRAFAAHNESATEPVQVRVGLNAGEPIAEDDDLFGTAVITAARVCAKAEGGEILASDAVRQIVAGKEFLFSDRGDVILRGFEYPVRLYEVRWREA